MVRLVRSNTPLRVRGPMLYTRGETIMRRFGDCMSACGLVQASEVAHMLNWSEDRTYLAYVHTGIGWP